MICICQARNFEDEIVSCPMDGLRRNHQALLVLAKLPFPKHIQAQTFIEFAKKHRRSSTTTEHTLGTIPVIIAQIHLYPSYLKSVCSHAHLDGNTYLGVFLVSDAMPYSSGGLITGVLPFQMA
eukprot:407659-Amphidinium_carterae.1